MKKSPNLEQWKREILRIVWKVNQYFYPQRSAQLVHEGYASFCHYYIMTRLEEKGILSPDAYLAFLHSHTRVVFQPSYDKPYYGGLNPYAVGFAICMDIKRMCEAPTDEDREWFPWLIGQRWQDAVKTAVFDFRNDSFIQQYLSPKVIRDLKLFSVLAAETADGESVAIVTEIHDEIGYKELRTKLAESYQLQHSTPQIVVTDADLEGDRTLYLKYVPYKGRELDVATAEMVADNIDFLWGYPVCLDDGRGE